MSFPFFFFFIKGQLTKPLNRQCFHVQKHGFSVELRGFFNDCYFMSLILKHAEDMGSSEIYKAVVKTDVLEVLCYDGHSAAPL